MKEQRTMEFDFSISLDELYIPVIDISSVNIVNNDVLDLISKHKKQKKPSSIDISEVLESLGNELFKSSDFDLYTIKDIYSIDALIDLNRIIVKYANAYLVKVLDNPFDYVFYLICFGKRDIEIHDKLLNNLDKLRSFIYLVVANAEIITRYK